MKYISLVVMALCVFSASCSPDKKERGKILIGKYLYLTDDGVLHCEEKCVGMVLAKDENGHKRYGMTFVDTLRIIDDCNLSYCTRCFNDERYDQVQEMIRRNSKNKNISDV